MSEKVEAVPLPKIHSSKLNPRKVFAGLESLGESIKEVGLIHPIIIRPSSTNQGMYEVVVGERRFRAYKDILKWKAIPAIVRKLTDDEAFILMVVENEKRKNLLPIDLGHLYITLCEKYNVSQRKLSKILDTDYTEINRHINLVKKLAPTVKQLLTPKKGESSAPLEWTLAVEFFDLPKKEQIDFAQKTITYGFTRKIIRERKKIATELAQEIEILPEGTKAEKTFKQKLEKEYLPRKFEGQPVLAEVRRDILKEKKLWVPTPKFEAELSPEMKRLMSMNKDYPNRTIVLSFDGNLTEIDRAIDEIKKMLQEDPQIVYFVFVAKI